MGCRLICALAVLLVACDGDGAEDAGAVDAGPACTDPPSLEAGDADGHPTPLAAGPGEARAGRLAASDLPPSPGVPLPWREGDYVLANANIAVAIEQVRVSDGFDPYGGMPAGVAAMEAGAMVDAADFNEVFFTFGAAALEVDSVTVLADGADGGPAVVRARGRATTLGFLDFLSGIVSSDVPDVELAIDYALAPDAEHVEITVHGASASTERVAVRQPLLWAMQQNRMPKHGPGFGFEVPGNTPMPYIAFAEDGASSFAFESGRADLRVYIEQNNLFGVLLPRFGFDPCAVGGHALGRIYVGRPGLDGALRAVESDRVAISGTVTDSVGDPVEGGHVHALSPDGAYLSRATILAGSFTVHVPGGETRLVAFRQGDAMSSEVTVTAPATDAALTLGPTGVVRVDVTNVADASPIPSLIQAIPLDADAVRPPRAYGERRVTSGRDAVVHSTGGTEQLRLPVGRHLIVASRGPEWEIASAEVDVTDRVTTDVALGLEHVIDTPGVLCGDFHVHTNRSFDTEDDVDLKLRATAGEGLEIPVRSDHEWVGSFEPAIARLGLEELMYGMGSLELTTFVYGHFGVFPLDADPAGRNGGTIEWVGRSAPEVLAEAASREGQFGTSAVMINHPREGLSILGYFTAAGYDPVTGVAAAQDVWWDEFRLLEVFNASSYDQSEAEVADWYSFLTRGRRVIAVGSSDSHQVTDKPVGYPRTCIDLGLDDPTALRAGGGAALVRDRLLAGAAAINGGVTVEAQTRDGGSLGDTLSGAMASEAIDVTVRAPLWVPVDRLRVIVDGEVTETIMLDDSTADPLEPVVRFRAPVQVDVAASGESFVVLVADGEGDLDPVYPGRQPFGVTNPIFLRR